MVMSDATPDLFGVPEWTHEDTRDYLSANPLPSDFVWPHSEGGKRAVHPSYRVKGGYGKWLHETPYFPGLFERIHELLFNLPELPPPEQIAAMLTRELASKDQTALPIS
jgi:hypothetical protein